MDELLSVDVTIVLNALSDDGDITEIVTWKAP